MSRVLVTREGAIGRITLARPEKKNALDRATADELTAAVVLLGGDADVRVLVVDAQGNDFCTGADLQALEQLIDEGPAAHRADAAALGRVFTSLRALTKPSVAVVRGRALAGGAGLATACDIVLAHEDATFGYPEVKVGFVPAMVMTMLRRVVGEKHALDLVLTGRPITSADAERIGLVSRVFSATEFDAAVASVVDGLAVAPASAVQRTKRLFVKLGELDFASGIEAGIEENVAARDTDEFRTGVRAFLAARRSRA